jgi:hypothetical protein
MPSPRLRLFPRPSRIRSAARVARSKRDPCTSAASPAGAPPAGATRRPATAASGRGTARPAARRPERVTFAGRRRSASPQPAPATAGPSTAAPTTSAGKASSARSARSTRGSTTPAGPKHGSAPDARWRPPRRTGATSRGSAPHAPANGRCAAIRTSVDGPASAPSAPTSSPSCTLIPGAPEVRPGFALTQGLLRGQNPYMGFHPVRCRRPFWIPG